MPVELQIQIIAACLLALIFLVIALFWLRERHLDGKPVSARVGAFIYGLILATFVTGVLMPVQQLMRDDPESFFTTEGRMIYIPTIIAFLLLLRSDLTGRIPLIGKFIRAYRSAILRRTIEGAEKRLDKMAALEKRHAEGV